MSIVDEFKEVKHQSFTRTKRSVISFIKEKSLNGKNKELLI